MSEPAGAFAVGEEIFIVSGPKILIYDHVTRKWREKDFEAAGGAENYSCVKIPAICWMLEEELFFVWHGPPEVPPQAGNLYFNEK